MQNLVASVKWYEPQELQEIIISLPTSDRTNLPPPHTGLNRVEDITALGVTFTKTLSFEPHVLKVANKAATCLYALKMLKAHG